MNNEFNNAWLNKIDEMTISWAKEFGKKMATQVDYQRETELTASQLRKFFGEVKRQQIRGFKKDEFILLKPKLAYAVAKKGKKKARINEFYKIFSSIIDNVKTEEQFKNFIKIFEAVVAYHTASEIVNV